MKYFEFNLLSEILGFQHGSFFRDKVLYCPKCTSINEVLWYMKREVRIDLKPKMHMIAPVKTPLVNQFAEHKLSEEYFFKHFKGRVILTPPVTIIRNKLSGKKAVIFGNDLKNIKKALMTLVSHERPPLPLGEKLGFEEW